MAQQISFAQAEYDAKRKTTRRDRFLAEMEIVVPWSRLLEVLKPHYYPGKTPGFAGGPKKFDHYGSPSRKLRAVSRQAHTCGESRWTNLRA